MRMKVCGWKRQVGAMKHTRPVYFLAGMPLRLSTRCVPGYENTKTAVTGRTRVRVGMAFNAHLERCSETINGGHNPPAHPDTTAQLRLLVDALDYAAL
jgi:hypothetical protein